MLLLRISCLNRLVLPRSRPNFPHDFMNDKLYNTHGVTRVNYRSISVPYNNKEVKLHGYILVEFRVEILAFQ